MRSYYKLSDFLSQEQHKGLPTHRDIVIMQVINYLIEGI